MATTFTRPRTTRPPGARTGRHTGRMGDPTATTEAPTTKRRNPLLVGGGLLLIAGSMLVGALLVNARGTRHAVVVSARDIPAGTLITTDMLRIDHLEAGTTLRSMPGASYGLLVGKVARERIPAGVLVVPEQVATALDPPPGFSLVALTLEPGELPVPTLTYGDTVDVVRTPLQASSDDPGRVLTRASVWTMWPTTGTAGLSGSGRRALTLAVHDTDAVTVAEAAAHREIRLVAVGGDPVFAQPTDATTNNNTNTATNNNTNTTADAGPADASAATGTPAMPAAGTRTAPATPTTGRAR